MLLYLYNQSFFFPFLEVPIEGTVTTEALMFEREEDRKTEKVKTTAVLETIRSKRKSNLKPSDSSTRALLTNQPKASSLQNSQSTSSKPCKMRILTNSTIVLLVPTNLPIICSVCRLNYRGAQNTGGITAINSSSS